jgi:asparagine synthase (glutamine-hydrolysing)
LCAVRKNKPEALLFSGGLDSSIIALLARPVAITVTLENGEDGLYAKRLAKRLNLTHHHRIITVDEAISVIPEIIEAQKTFNLGIPNDIPVFFGLKTAKELGIKSIATGDGADELFCGYSYMEDIKDLNGYIKRLAKSMCFSSNLLSEYIGIELIQPYLDKDVVELSLEILPELKIREECRKWILRKAFEDVLPKESVWQEKRPLEIGSGTTIIRDKIEKSVRDEDFRRCDLPLKNKEHYYYYRIYKDVVGEIPRGGDEVCRVCGADTKDALWCKVCGDCKDL